MEKTGLMVEGDINFSDERRKWSQQITDRQTIQILEDDARYFLHQSMSTPCIDVLENCEGSSLTTLSGKKLLDFHGNNVHQLGYGNEYVISRITEQIQRLSFSPGGTPMSPPLNWRKSLPGYFPET